MGHGCMDGIIMDLGDDRVRKSLELKTTKLGTQSGNGSMDRSKMGPRALSCLLPCPVLGHHSPESRHLSILGV